MIKRSLRFPIKICLRLTGKWRGSARTRVTKIKIGRTPVSLDGNIMSTSGRTYAILKPGVMGISINLF
jgi:hypothetical protein